MKINDIQFGDIVTYRSGRVNNVNNPYNYHRYFNEHFKNPTFGKRFDIMKIQRYVKVLGFYKLKTVYKRGNEYYVNITNKKEMV